jgi:molybdate transport repressor ModE-like protein
MSKSFDRLNLLNTFVRIADSGSISAAAKDLGISQPSASRHLVELETSFKTQLIRRNTHSLALTDSGDELLKDARLMLADWEALEEKFINVEKEVKGSLKVVAPIALGQLHLARIATEFQLAHPNVNLSWQLEDSQIRFTELGCDCWIKIGNIEDDTLIVKQIGSVTRILVGSPTLISEPIKDEIDLVQKYPIVSLSPFEAQEVPLSKQGIIKNLRFKSAMQTNNIFAVKEACKLGLGLSVMPTWFIQEELQTQLLINVLPEWYAPELPIHIAYLPNKHQPLRLRLFVEHIEQELSNINGIMSTVHN